MNKKNLRRLYRSFEDRLSEKERGRLEEALARSPELRREKQRIQQQRIWLAEGAAASFGPGFADRVMGRLDASASDQNAWELFYANLSLLFRRFAVAGVVILLLLLIYNLRLGDAFSLEEAFFASDTTFEELQRLPLF